MELNSLRKANRLFAANAAASANPIGEAGTGNPIANLAQSFAAFLAKGGNRMSSAFTSPTAVNPSAVAEAKAERPDASSGASARDDKGAARDRVNGKSAARTTDKPKARTDAKDKPAQARDRKDDDDTTITKSADDKTTTASASSSDDDSNKDSTTTTASAAASDDDNAAAQDASADATTTSTATNGVQTQEAAATVAANGLSQVLVTEIEVDVVETETTVITVSGPGAAQAAAELSDALGVDFTPTSDQNSNGNNATQQAAVDTTPASQAAQAQDQAADAEALLRAAANPELTQQVAGIAKAAGSNQHVSVQVTSSESQSTTTGTTSSPALASILAQSDSVTTDTADAVVSSAGSQTANNSTTNTNANPMATINALAQAATADAAQVADDMAGATTEIKGVGAASGSQASQSSGSTQAANAETATNTPVSSAPSGSTNSTNSTAPSTPTAAKPTTHHQPLTEQISVHIDQALQQGLDKIKIQLRPEDMGRIEVRLEVGQGGQLNTTIIADRPETLDALRRDSGELERALRAAGLDPQSGGMQFNLRGEQNRDQQAGNNGQSGRGAFGDEGVPGLGDDQATDNSNAVWTRRETRAAARGGLDIRV